MAPAMPIKAQIIQAGKNAPNISNEGAPALEQPLKHADAENKSARIKDSGCFERPRDFDSPDKQVLHWPCRKAGTHFSGTCARRCSFGKPP
jgi:hypothetical protein